MDMATGRISRWLVAEGAAVKQGDPLFEIETDKAAMEIEAPASGTLRNIVKEGSDVPVGNAVARIVAAGESFSGAVASAAAAAAIEVKKAPAAEAAPAVAAAVHTSAVNGVRTTPLARRLDKLLHLRADLNAGATAYKLSINDMIIKAWALALRDVPAANATWTDGTMLLHDAVDIGVAVSIDGGLITPIVRDAGTKALSAISNELKDLAARAKAKKLKNDEYQGGATAISDLGMFGVKDFAAIINPPHATILTVGAGEQRGAWENGVFVPATLMTVTLSIDHRAADGALGAQALQAFRGYIEKPLSMLV